MNMKIFGLTGWSGSGKTTLIRRLVPALIGRGLRVSTMKHAHHGFDMDKPGKDSYVHREAGAVEVMISSRNRWVLQHENREGPEPPMEELLRYMSPVDLVLIEGFKTYPHDKLEVYRAETGKPLMAADIPSIVAIATDVPDVVRTALPVLDLNDAETIADFVIDRCGLLKVRSHGAA
jgi:molybdopterin-guanine dinucleotide biosynthesis adapter protein